MVILTEKLSQAVRRTLSRPHFVTLLSIIVVIHQQLAKQQVLLASRKFLQWALHRGFLLHNYLQNVSAKNLKLETITHVRHSPAVTVWLSHQNRREVSRPGLSPKSYLSC